MQYIIFMCAVISLLIVPGHSIAEAPAPVPAPIVVVPVVVKPLTPQELVRKYAQQYHVSETQMLGTMKCESSFNPNAVGDHGNSFGLSQIHLPSHPHITQAQAKNPVFATEFMAKEFAQGHQRKWTCWRNLYGNPPSQN